MKRRAIHVGGSRIGVGSALAVAAMAGLFGSRSASAGTWDGGGGDNNWSTAANWAGDTAPVANDVLAFDGTTQLSTNNDFAANTQFNGLNFAAGAGGFTLGGNAMLLGWDGVTPATINQDSANAQLINFGTPGVPGTAGLILDGATVNVGGTGAGSLTINQLTFGQAPLATTASTLNVNRDLTINGLTVQTRNTSPTANVINVAGGSTLSLTGPFRMGSPTVTGQGNLVTLLNISGAGNVNATTANNSNFIIGTGNDNTGGQAQSTLDMSGLTGNFTYSTGATGTGQFLVGRSTRPAAVLRLGSGTNTITADQLEVGDSNTTPGFPNGSNNNAGGTSRLFLGSATNTINVDTINVGVTKSTGIIDWQAATGSLTLRAQDGTGRVGTITVGNFNSGSATNVLSRVLFAGHDVDVSAGTVIAGRLAATGSPTGANDVTFDRGTFDVNSLQLGVNISGVSANGISGAFTLGTLGDPNATGTLNVNTQFILGNDSANTTFTPTGGSLTNVPTKATFNVNSGTANVFTDITVNRNNTAGAIDLDESTINLAGGTVDMHGHNIGSYAAPVKSINLTGGSLANAAVIAGKSITVGATAVSGSPRYVLADGGSLTAPSGLTLGTGASLEGGSAAAPGTITGDVTVNAGGKIDPSIAGTAGTLTFNNNLTLNTGSTVNFDIGDTVGNNDVINVAGNLTLGGTINLATTAIGAGATAGNTYTLFNYTGALTGNETNFATGSGGTRKVFTVLPTGSTPGTIQVSVGGGNPLSLTYIGNVNSNWDVQGASNWDSSGPQQFFNQDTVTFNDTSTNVNAIQLVDTVLPNAVTVFASRNYTFSGSGSIGGAAALTKDGNGTLTINTGNTNTGGTTIVQGTIVVGTGGSLGSGPIANNNGSLVFDKNDDATVASVISGGGSLTKSGTGVLTLTGANTYSGATTISAGTIKANTAASVGDAIGALTVASGATFDIGGNTTANNFNLGGKTVHIAGNGVGGTAGAIANSGGATQNNAFNNITLDADALITGARIDIGRNVAVATRTLDLANHTLTVNMTGTQPVFSVLDGVTVTPGNIVAAAGGLNFERSSSTPANGGTITMNSGTNLQVFQTTSGALARPIVLKGNNVVGSGSTTAGIITSNISLEGNVTFEALGSGVPSLTANNPLTIEGVISESGGARSVTKLGVSTVTLSADNTYTGGTTITGGTVQLGAGGATGSITGDVTNNGALAINRTDTALNLSGTISGTGSVTNLGAGTATLSGANSYSGGTTVTAGTLVAGHGDAFGGGALTVADGAVAQAQSGLSKALTVTALTTNTSGKLDITNNSAVLRNMTVPQVQTLVQSAFTSGTWSGPGLTSSTAATASPAVTAVGFASNGILNKTSFKGVTGLTAADVLVKYTYYGDSDLSGATTLDDFTLFLNGYQNAGNTWVQGDYDYNGAVTLDDFTLFLAGYQQQGAPLSQLEAMINSVPMSSADRASMLAAVEAVPEPTALGLLGLAGAGLLARRRRR